MITFAMVLAAYWLGYLCGYVDNEGQPEIPAGFLFGFLTAGFVVYLTWKGLMG